MDKTILITGCGSGIGLHAAQGLKAHGWHVFASVRNPLDIARLQGLELDSLWLDVNDSASIQAAIQAILEKTQGKLTALFNNCGYAQPGAIEDLTSQAIKAQFATNFFGPIELTNAIIPIMRRQGYGRIINNSSILGLFSLPYRGAYCASKFALEGITDALRMELAPANIHVSLLEPGPIISQFRQHAFTAYQQHIDVEHSLHQKTYIKLMNEFYLKEGYPRFTLSPEAVLKKLLHALESSRPKARYAVGFASQVLTLWRRLSPTSCHDWLAKKI